MYAKVINEETKACEVGLGTNSAFYKSIGMSEMEVEQAYDGQWYLKGYAPEKPIEEKKAEVRAIRNQYLKQYVDDRAKSPFMWNEVSEEEKALIGEYRKYLMDYPETEGWYEHSPMNFEEWKASYESSPVQRLDKQRNCKSTGKSV